MNRCHRCILYSKTAEGPMYCAGDLEEDACSIKLQAELERALRNGYFLPIPVGGFMYALSERNDGTKKLIASRVTGYYIGVRGMTVQNTKFYAKPVEDIDDFTFFRSIDAMKQFYQTKQGELPQWLEVAISEWETIQFKKENRNGKEKK